MFFKIKWVLFTSTQKRTPFSCVGKKNILFLERDHKVKFHYVFTLFVVYGWALLHGIC